MALHGLRYLSVAFLVGLLAATAGATTYVEVLSATQVSGGDANMGIQRMAVCEGTTTYHFLANVSGGTTDLKMNKVTGVGSSPTTSTLTTLASWTADVGAPGSSRVFTGFGMAIVGDSIQIADSQNDAIFRVDKNTGVVSTYVAKSAIQTFVGGTPDVQNWNGFSPTGEAVFYEGYSKSILQTNGTGVVTTLVSQAQLSAAQSGTLGVGSGLTYDGAGNLYWGENTTDKVYKRAPDGTITAVLGPTELTPLISSNISFSGDMFYAPDGWIYMRAGTSTYQSVLRFNTSNPTGTVQTFLSNADLVGGPAASASIMGMSWYNGNLAFTTTGLPYYAVPEPATLALLGLGGLLIARRQRA